MHLHWKYNVEDKKNRTIEELLPEYDSIRESYVENNKSLEYPAFIHCFQGFFLLLLSRIELETSALPMRRTTDCATTADN